MGNLLERIKCYLLFIPWIIPYLLESAAMQENAGLSAWKESSQQPLHTSTFHSPLRSLLTALAECSMLDKDRNSKDRNNHGALSIISPPRFDGII